VAAAGFRWITPWRREIDERQPAGDAESIRAAGLRVRSYCRTAYLAHDSEAARRGAVDDNRRALDAAAALGARELIAVVGGLADGSRDVDGSAPRSCGGSRPDAGVETTGVKIAREPLHPFYAADRSCSTRSPGSGLVRDAGPRGRHWHRRRRLSRLVGLPGAVVPGAGPDQSLHVSDWLRHTQEPLLDRGMMGDGVIDLRRLRAMVEATGFDGPVEVEIFSRDRWWKEDPDVVLRTCRERLETVC
jgi:sugar phosphate isomerase/epimerase